MRLPYVVEEEDHGEVKHRHAFDTSFSHTSSQAAFIPQALQAEIFKNVYQKVRNMRKRSDSLKLKKEGVSRLLPQSMPGSKSRLLE